MIDNPLRGKNKARSVAIGCAVILVLLIGVMLLSRAINPATGQSGVKGAAQSSSPASSSEGEAGAEGAVREAEAPATGGGEGDASSAPAVQAAAGEGSSDGPSFLAETEETTPETVPGTGSVLLKVVLGLGVVIVLIFVARALLRKMSGAPVKTDMDLLSVLSFTRLAEKQGIYAVRAGERVLLVGTSESGLHTLGELPAGDFQCVELDPGDFALELAACGSPEHGEKAGTGQGNWVESLKWKTVRG